jgi:hypothetical protein
MTEAIQLMLDWSEVEDEKTYYPWILTHKGDQSCRLLADKHYSRQTIGAKMFTRPGENLVFRLADGSALWVSWRSKYKRKDGYGYCIENTIFRNESSFLSSDLIKMAMYATTQEWGEIPQDGFLTYVDPRSVQSKNAGHCFEKAGFRRQKKRSTRGYIPYLTDQTALNLVLEEMGAVRFLECCKEQIICALHSGEYMEAYEFQEMAREQLSFLEQLKDKMKQQGLKAWSKYELPLTEEDLDLLTDHDFGWMLDKEYLQRKGLELS